MGKKEDFVRDVAPHVVEAARKSGLDPLVVLSMAALETGWGTKAHGNNQFNIKGKGQTLRTHEYIDGEKVALEDEFRAYVTPRESFLDFTDLMAMPRYDHIAEQDTPEEQIAAIARSGYTTLDPEVHKTRLLGVFNSLPVDTYREVEKVVELQEALKKAGKSPGSIDGIHGPKTDEALEAFTQKFGKRPKTADDIMRMAPFHSTPDRRSLQEEWRTRVPPVLPRPRPGPFDHTALPASLRQALAERIASRQAAPMAPAPASLAEALAKRRLRRVG